MKSRDPMDFAGLDWLNVKVSLAYPLAMYDRVYHTLEVNNKYVNTNVFTVKRIEPIIHDGIP